MNRTEGYENVVELLAETKEISQKILQLPLNEDTSVEELNQLQHQQENVRLELQRLLQLNPSLLDERIKTLASDCLQVESQVHHKLLNFQNKIQKEFQQFKQKSNIMKNNYGTYVQASGYFIDQHVD